MASLVEKATSDMLIGPDWAMNMEICDIINHDPGAAKDVVKALKKRLGNRNPKVQLLALTVLETIVKNCGVAVHQQVAEKDVLHEMVKIVKRKTDMHVRDKILVLLMSWQEAFGGARGRYPQYYMAFEELRRMGVEFPDRPAERDAPIFTPPQTQPVLGYGSPAHMPSRLEALMNNEAPGLSLTEIETARGRVEVLLEMLNAINPRDKQAVKEELIVELVEQCRSTQQRVMSLVNNTSDEELLRQGLGLNDDLQKVLEKHDAIASGKAEPAPAPAAQAKAPEAPQKDVEDDFVQLARRSFKESQAEPADPFVQLALPAPPTPSAPSLKPTSSIQKASDLIDLLSGESFASPVTPPVTPPQQQAPAPASPQVSSGNPFGPEFHAVPQPSFPQQEQGFANGSMFNSQAPQFPANDSYNSHPQHFGANGTAAAGVGAPFSSSSPQQQQQQQAPGFASQQQMPSPGYTTSQAQSFSFQPQYQDYNQSGYVAPWARQELSPQQQAMIYGSGYQGSPQLSSQPAAPWASSQQQQQQQQMYAGSSYYNGSAYAGYGQQYPLYSDQYSYQYGASSYYQNGVMGSQQQTGQGGGLSGGVSGNQLALVPVSGSGSSGSAGGQASKPAGDKLFEDLVDMQGLSSKFKSAGISSSLSRPTGSL